MLKQVEERGVIDCRDAVEHIEIAWVPMKDGRKLAARLLLPKDPAQRPCPAVLEYIPYRRRDGTRVRDDETHYWFAANGYGVARVDISGTGDSDGLVEDEYVKREQDDALEIIDWLSKQPWCSGSVGMIGISWGGFNGLQVAARRPPALKAVVSLCSTVDRYADDVHFMGGCLLNDTLDWGGYFFTIGALPPDPAMVGEDRWKDLWRHRVENAKCPPIEWMAHQRRDAFWKHGSVCEDYSKIEAPVLVASGWVDGYTAAVFRLVENLKMAKGIAGPWGHKYPHVGVPGPAIGFLQECKRWWDRWLKGENNGVEKDPAMRVWLQDSETPRPHFDVRGGRWVGFPDWPSANVRMRTVYLGAGTLNPKAQRARPVSISSPLTTGSAAGEWCAYALGKIAPEMPLDQRYEDAASLVFDGDRLKSPLAIVGRTYVKLRVASDKPQAQLAVRLNCVHPNGSVERVTYGLLNLSHRESHEKPTPLKKGQFYDVTVELNEIAQTIPAGARLRIAVSTSYWPIAWPSPEKATVTIDPSKSRIELPVLASDKGLKRVKFEPSVRAQIAPTTVTRAGSETRHLIDDIENETTMFEIRRDDGTYVIDEIGTEISYTKLKQYVVHNDDPGRTRSRIACTAHYRRDQWDVRVETDLVMTSDKTHFHLHGTIKTFDHDRTFVDRDFKKSFKRDNL